MTRYRISRKGRKVEFDDECLVGRRRDCDLRLAHRSVSRHHARLLVCAYGVVVEDLGSRNGVHVDGERISGRQMVVGTHRIHLGDCELILESVDEAGAESHFRDLDTVPDAKLDELVDEAHLAEVIALGR